MESFVSKAEEASARIGAPHVHPGNGWLLQRTDDAAREL
jgi:hypothetical protein